MSSNWLFLPDSSEASSYYLLYFRLIGRFWIYLSTVICYASFLSDWLFYGISREHKSYRTVWWKPSGDGCCFQYSWSSQHQPYAWNTVQLVQHSTGNRNHKKHGNPLRKIAEKYLWVTPADHDHAWTEPLWWDRHSCRWKNSLGSCCVQSELYYLTINQKRGQVDMDAANVLSHFQGITVHDFWGSYWKYQDVTHAICCAHLLRELNGVIENHPEYTDMGSRSSKRFC